MGLFGQIPAHKGGVGQGGPGLQAHIIGVSLLIHGPDPQVGVVVKRQGHAGPSGFIHKLHGLGGKLVQHQSVQAVGHGLQSDAALFQRNDPAFGGHHGGLVHAVGVETVHTGETDRIVCHGLAGGQSGVEAVVVAQLVVHGLPAGVFHGAGFLQLIARQLKGDRQAEVEGPHGQGFGAALQHKGGAVFGLGCHREHRVPGKAVGTDLVLPALEGVAAVFQPADEGEQQGGVAAPDTGVGLPDVLHALCTFHGAELGAFFVDLCGEVLVVNGDHFSGSPFRWRPSSTASARSSPT